MVNAMRLVECIAFMLMQDSQVLAEKRNPSRRVVLGAIARPGGHIEAHDSPNEELYGETWEEGRLISIEIAYIYTLLRRAQGFRKLHYFAVMRCEGSLIPQEAEIFGVAVTRARPWTSTSIRSPCKNTDVPSSCTVHIHSARLGTEPDAVMPKQAA
jgi:8-oxo-dGTP diphosphatase